ncbi:Spy/CpxP family protein refolding chaperone [Rhodoferax sp. TBRC 17660]|uniref:Spy/CpxP family protein refolding chaperone n=1 Tax=Rhodoferax potami TaxID=3068338 RepID=A0ABU3KN24_9BURK|nr:Spy/CpxP family protein refolding chaperone [Rhodoferax sp. TBRC 17660]MDT7518916.1 Spy/CpxP family protein refolding chaperone [Rhodoferax sp. TBRC 17660]
MKPAFKTLVVAGLLATAGFSVMAQKHGNPDEAMGGRPGMHRMDPAKMEEMHAKRSAELKDKLKITAAQEANWTTFSNAMKPAARADKPKMDRAELAKLSTPERLDKMKAMRTEMTSEHNSRMEQRDQAVKTFYSTLTPEQKKIFDTESSKHKGGHGGKSKH